MSAMPLYAPHNASQAVRALDWLPVRDTSGIRFVRGPAANSVMETLPETTLHTALLGLVLACNDVATGSKALVKGLANTLHDT